MSDPVLIEKVVSAHRQRNGKGEIQASPAFFDLDESGRVEAFEQAMLQRTLEAALDPDGLSSTAHSLLDRIRRG